VGATWAAKQLGGDYFDYFIHMGRLNLIVADIMGKGVAAALLMSILRSHFRTVFQHSAQLSTANVNRFNEMVYADFKPQRAFATVLLMSLNLSTHELAVLSAGHHAPLLAGPNGITEIVTTSVPALGLFNRPVDGQAVHRIRLRPGEALLAYTDGVLDAVSDGGERFGSQRLKDAFAAAYLEQREPLHLLHAVRKSVDQFASVQPDDTTLCVLQRNHA
jgi:sigma-B regulation protein RsbU (phosphoserine phosphatase)